MTWMACLLGLVVVASPGVASAAPVVNWVPGSTKRIVQITGDVDAATGTPTPTRTFERAQLAATDLGSSFEHNGRLVLLFGDSHGGHAGDLDTWAVSTATRADHFAMQIPTDETSVWRPIAPPDLRHGAFCVPSHGLSHDGAMVVLYTQSAAGNDADTMKRSFLIQSRDDGATWATLYQLPNGGIEEPRFVNGYFVRHEGFIYLFGSGKYRASSPTLARAEEALFPAREAWTYFAGVDEAGAVRWCADPENTAMLFAHNVVGEFSCEWIEPIKCWVMLYNSSQPRGIVMRAAPQPWGPWSDAQVIFDPWRDGGYGQFLHVAGGSDRVGDPGRAEEWGGEYGPYLIPRFCAGDASRCELVYTMSTWNPYAVVLMRSVVAVAPGDGFGLANPAAPIDPSPRP